MNEEHMLTDLFLASLDLTAELHLEDALQRFVKHACRLSGARFGALAILDNWGDTSLIICHGGISEASIRSLERSELGQSVSNTLAENNYCLINAVSREMQPEGYTPFLHNILAVPVTVHEQIYGHLYLTDKLGGFYENDISPVQMLSQAADVAVQNADHYSIARNRERWIAASQTLMTTMLQGTDEEEALVLIAKTVMEVSHSDTVIIVLPSVGERWVAEIVEGAWADKLVGLVFPREGRALTVLNEETGMIVDSMARAQNLRLPIMAHFGPALYAPLPAVGEAAGVLILLRKIGRQEFDSADLPLAESLASQAALALELASARHAEDVATLHDERGRIGRDLHDFAIQQLFATGMRLDTAKQRVASGELDHNGIISMLDESLASVDDAVRQIRAIVHDLREPDTEAGLVERLRQESSLSRSFLGFAPSLVISLDEITINEDEDQAGELIDQVDTLADSVGEDVVAVVREGLSNIARHARATAGRVAVTLHPSSSNGGYIEVRIADDGQGIDPEHTRNSGLANLRERARAQGGKFTYGVGLEGRGTEIVWTAILS